MKKAAFLSMAVAISAAAYAQPGFQKTSRGLGYKFIKDAPGKNAVVGDVMEVELIMTIGDSVFMDTRQSGQPAQFPLAAPSFNGDLMEGFSMMSPGDVAIFKMPIDSLPTNPENPIPDFFKKAGTMDYSVTLLSVKTQQEAEAEQKKKMADQELAAKAQVGIDAQTMKAYLKANKIVALPVSDGIFYRITKKGTGPMPKNGDNVSMNYTGKLLNDSVFDSNVLPRFNHVEPFIFKLGTGQVIQGWEKGVAMLPKGTKATLYIPSGMAYGLNGRPPMIPANSILIFDVEVVDVKGDESAMNDDKVIQDYLKSHKVKNAVKTASGMYYSITKLGTGPKPLAGQTVSMNYTGKLTTDTVFDSNIIPSFGHVQPFEFPLGQGRVIKGWDEGVALLPVGTKAVLYIPSAMGYGAAGSPPVIPQNAPLVFEVEVVEIKK